MRTLVAAVTVVALTLSMSVGCGGGSKKVSNPPTAGFTHVPENPAIGAPVTFTDTSTVVAPKTITTWTWTFTGGSITTYSGQTPPTVSFATSGFHNVSLTVKDSKGATNTYTHAVGVVDPLDTTKPDIDVTKVVLKGTATDNVSVTALTDKIGAGAATTVPGFVAGPTVNFNTHDITTTGAGTTNVTIHAADAAANATDVNVVITETIVP